MIKEYFRVACNLMGFHDEEDKYEFLCEVFGAFCNTEWRCKCCDSINDRVPYNEYRDAEHDLSMSFRQSGAMVADIYENPNNEGKDYDYCKFYMQEKRARTISGRVKKLMGAIGYYPVSLGSKD